MRRRHKMTWLRRLWARLTGRRYVTGRMVNWADEDYTTSVRIPLDNMPDKTRRMILEANRIGAGFPVQAVLDAVFGKPPSGGGEGNTPAQAGTTEGGGEMKMFEINGKVEMVIETPFVEAAQLVDGDGGLVRGFIRFKAQDMDPMPPDSQPGDVFCWPVWIGDTQALRRDESARAEGGGE